MFQHVQRLFRQISRPNTDFSEVPGRSVHPRSVHPFTFFSFSAFLSTRRGPCRSEAPSAAGAAPGVLEPLIGGARWRSMGELRLGRSVTWSFCRWTYRQGTLLRQFPEHFIYNNNCPGAWYYSFLIKVPANPLQLISCRNKMQLTELYVNKLL
jgi:hypothetical protein